MVPFIAEEPYRTEDAPFKTSICPTFSVGKVDHFTSPRSGDSMVNPSRTTITREPTPYDQPLPALIFACPSATFKPETLRAISSIRKIFELANCFGFISSIEITSSLALFSKKDPVITTSFPNKFFGSTSKLTFNSIVSLSTMVIVFLISE